MKSHPRRDLEERMRYLKPKVVGLSIDCAYFIDDAMHAGPGLSVCPCGCRIPITPSRIT